MENKGSTTAHDGSITAEGVFFSTSGNELLQWPHTAINKELPIITLEKFVKYYGVSYTGTGFEYWL